MQSKKDFSSLLNSSPPSYYPEPSWQSNYHTGSSEQGLTSPPYQQRYPFPEKPRQGESRLPLPSSLQALIPPTSPQSLWTSASSSPPLGVGTDFAQPSFKERPTQDTGPGFLQNPRLVKQRLPNFTPIPVPQVTPSAILFLFSGSEVQQPIWSVVHPDGHNPITSITVSAKTWTEATKPTGWLDKTTSEAFLK